LSKYCKNITTLQISLQEPIWQFPTFSQLTSLTIPTIPPPFPITSISHLTKLLHLDVQKFDNKDFKVETVTEWPIDKTVLSSLETLKISGSCIFNSDLFPNLKTLWLYSMKGGWPVKDLVKFLEKHKQLVSFRACGVEKDSHWDLPATIRQTNPLLEEFIFAYQNYSAIQKVESGFTAMNKLKEEQIPFRGYEPKVEARFDFISGHSRDSEWW
jgi:hypothetical protein